MSYSIIFETKIMNLKDGRVLHLDLSGCNNDDSGRSRDEFRGKIYTLDEFKAYIAKFKEREQPEGFELKIGNRYCSFIDYGNHLERMLKRATSFEEISKQRIFYAKRYDGAEVISPIEKTMTPKEFSDFYDECYKNDIKFSWRRILTTLHTEDDMVKSLEDNSSVAFFLGRKGKMYFYQD